MRCREDTQDDIEGYPVRDVEVRVDARIQAFEACLDEICGGERRPIHLTSVNFSRAIVVHVCSPVPANTESPVEAVYIVVPLCVDEELVRVEAVGRRTVDSSVEGSPLARGA